MIFTPTIQKAIQFAIIAHAGQTRKGKPDVPYITHPLTVGLILARANAVDDVVCAGILHDTVEDSDGNITLDDIEDEFGPAIATLVGHVTEQDKSLLWEQRKTDALAHIYQMPYDALLLKSADVLANLNDLLGDLEKEGELVWKRFGTAKDNKIQQQKNLLEAFETIWPENPLLPEIKSGVERICLRK